MTDEEKQIVEEIQSKLAAIYREYQGRRKYTDRHDLWRHAMEYCLSEHLNIGERQK